MTATTPILGRRASRAVLGLALMLGVALGSGAAFGAVTRLPAKTCRYWAQVFVPIGVSPATGVTSMDFSVAYDPMVVTPRGLYRTPLTTGYALSYDLSTSGVVTAHLSGSSPLSDSGDVLWIAFEPM